MRTAKRHLFARAFITASTLAIATGSTAVWAQDDQAASDADSQVQPAPMPAPAASNDTSAAPATGNEIVVTGLRASLRDSMNLKRNAQGIVDAISAEDIGKFPDTNLAEALQRVTGVSIDRSNGEGQYVTVRGFGPAFNLVLLNGREMPASNIGPGSAAPSSRSFDFANLAPEGIAAVEVYKSGRATLPTGGIGSTINIQTPRPLDKPGFNGSLSVKAVKDHTSGAGIDITPEVSGIVSDTFADNRIGILLSGSYQKRRASLDSFTAGWREGYLGSENNWGSLAMPTYPAGTVINNVDVSGQPDPRYDHITNRPGPNDIYQVTQNAAYNFTDIDTERLNGQAVLQFRPVDSLTATVDYTYSQYTVDSRTNSIGVWFNHNDTSSAWTDGPAAGPLFYSEHFQQSENKDLSISGNATKNRNINRSLGGNIKWEGPAGFRLEVDAHHSTAESKPTSPLGSSMSLGSSIFGVEDQTIDYTHAMPVMSVSMYPGSEISASNIRPSGNAFYNAYMRDRINQLSVRGGFDFNTNFIESLDFGVTLTDNAVRTAYGYLQNDTWGGTLTADELPDSFYTTASIPGNLGNMDGAQAPGILPTYFNIDTTGLANFLEDQIGICSSPATGTPTGEGCLAEYSVDNNIREKTLAPYAQVAFKFDIGNMLTHLRAGVRYERTKISSTSLSPVYTGTLLASYNEISVQNNPDDTQLTSLSGEYHNWLPAVDFDISPVRNVILRASYSHTITRPNYGDLNGSFTVNSPARIDGGSTAGSGNPGLLPYKSKNIDLSAEWYYGPSSYISIGYFHKQVSDFIGTTFTNSTLYGLTNPGQGAIFKDAVAALGAGAPFFEDKDRSAPSIMRYIYDNYRDAGQFVFSTNQLTGQQYISGGGIIGQPGDPLIDFTINKPGNSDQVANLSGWEFAIQHNFWNTGFGTILNYTIVNSDQNYDNTLRYTATQFAITGVSNSANAVLFYEKNGLQARLAYNWRDGFLSGYGTDPYYTEPYGQFDVSASYDFPSGFSVFMSGINITNANQRGHMRNDNIVTFATPGYSRYSVGLRYKF